MNRRFAVRLAQVFALSISSGFAFAQTTLTATDAAPAGSVDLTQSGFSIRPHVISVNRPSTIAAAESQLAGLFPSATDPAANEADLAGADADGYLNDPDVINWSEDSGVGPEVGNFRATEVPATNYPDEAIPGALTDNNLAYEILTFLDLKQGSYTMGVNSDDGFKVTAGARALDAFATPLGSFNGPRGSTDTTFNFTVAQDGIYPFRLLWFEGVGDASVEWFIVTNNQKVLLNDGTKAGHIKAYAKGNAQAYGAYVRKATPVPGSTGVATDVNFNFEIVDARTQVTAGSVQLRIDGQDVTETVAKNNGVTTVSFNPPQDLSPGEHSVALIFSDGTERTLQGTVTIDYLASPAFFIEAEDFNYDSGQHKVEADSWTYEGGLYSELSAVRGVDFNDGGNPEPESDVYRLNETGNVGIATDADIERGTFTATTTYKVGWTDAAGDWYNYTRNFSNGLYKVVARLSHGRDNPTDIMGGQLDLVTSNPALPSQTTQKLGTFRAPASGGWSLWDFVPLKDDAGNDAVVRLSGVQTVRYSPKFNGGDINYIAFLPQANNLVIRPVVESTSPLANGAAIREHEIVVNFADRDTKVVSGTVKLFLNGAEVTNATITDTVAGATLRYTPPPGSPDTTNTIRVVFGDDATPSNSQEFTFRYRVSAISSASYFIETEDFNYDNGQFKPGIAKAQYSGLAAELGVDYNDNGNPETQSDIYRLNEPNNVGMAIVNDVADGQRPGFETVSDYKIGWTAPGDWYNYTRVFPQSAAYNVFARMSRDDDVAGVVMGGYLDEVTSPANVENQTTTRLGTFSAPPSGGWDTYQLIPLKNEDGSLALINVGGQKTLRYTVGFDGGDVSYLMFVPVVVVDDFEVSIARQGNQLILSWAFEGVLESSPVLGATANWTPVANSNRAGTTITPEGQHRFFRVRRT